MKTWDNLKCPARLENLRKPETETMPAEPEPSRSFLRPLRTTDYKRYLSSCVSNRYRIISLRKLSSNKSKICLICVIGHTHGAQYRADTHRCYPSTQLGLRLHPYQQWTPWLISRRLSSPKIQSSEHLAGLVYDFFGS